MARRFDRWSRRSDEGLTNDFNKFVARLESVFDTQDASIKALKASTATIQTSMDTLISTTNTFIPSGGGGGPPVPGPPPSALTPVIAVPSGPIPGSTYTLPSTPQASTLILTKNGVVQNPGAGNDYTLSGATITMLSPTVTNDSLLAYYWR